MTIRGALAILGTALIGLQLIACDGNGGGGPGAGEGEVCGGIAMVPCAKGLFCKYKPGTCDVADRAAACALVPEVCSQEYDPVCGCDGKTYSNACMADMAGMSIDYKGECG